MLSQTQKDNIKDRIKEFLNDYDYEYKEEDGTFKIPISQIDYFISQYLGRSIYIESLRGNAGEFISVGIYLFLINKQDVNYII